MTSLFGFHRPTQRASIVLIFFVLLLSSAATLASAKGHPTRTVATGCRVGSAAPPPIPRNPYGGRTTLSVPPTIVGCGRSQFGRLILIAYEIKHPPEFCFSVFVPSLGTLSGGECKAENETWASFRCPSGFCLLNAFGAAWQRGLGFRASVVSGLSTVPMRAVNVTWNRAGHRHQAIATVGSISGALAERFHQREPFEVFGTAIACTPSRSMDAQGTATSGDVLTATPSRYPEVFRHPCHPPPPPKPQRGAT